MKEIGGYFELERLINKEYYADLTALNSARYALVYLIRARGIRRLYLPYLLCGSVAAACRAEGCDITFYEVSSGLRPLIDGIDDGAYLYLVNYYGQLDSDEIDGYRERFKRVIVDNVQAFFQRPTDGVDTIYSCRKFFGVPDGAYLATDVRLDEELPTDVSSGRLEHLLGRFELGSASDYYGAFKQNDAAFADCGPRLMSRLTHNLMGAVDYTFVRESRERNFAVLKQAFEGMNPLAPRMPEGPFAYPLLTENGDELRRRLAQRHIYVPTLWPDEHVRKSESAYKAARDILPLPCDQRYDEQDMLTIINEVKQCIV